jgi:hypothetical protein
MSKNNDLILGIDCSTKCLGIALYELKTQKLILLTHVSPKVKITDDMSPIEVLFKKSHIFENEFLKKYVNSGIKKVVIEEPLLGSNNVHTVATLLKFNGMVSKAVYEMLGVSPDYISSYDARKYAFPELMHVRSQDKDGKFLTEKELKNKKPVLFGGYPKNVDKKLIIWEKVADREPQIIWLYDKHQRLKKESFDLSDAATAVIGYCHKTGIWK